MAAMVQAGIILRDAQNNNKAALQKPKLVLRQASTAEPATTPAADPHPSNTRRSSLTAHLHQNSNPNPAKTPLPPSGPCSSSRPSLRQPHDPAAPPAAAPAPGPSKPRRSRPKARPIPRVDSLPFAMDDEDPSPHVAAPPPEAPLTPSDHRAIDAIRRAAQPTTPPEHRLAIHVADAYLQHPPPAPSDPPAGMLHTIARHLDLQGYTIHIKTGLTGGVGRQCFQHQPHTFIQCGTLRSPDASSLHHASPSGAAASSAPSSLASSPALAPEADWTLLNSPTDPAALPTGGRLIVDPQLREQFAIASRTTRYAAMLAAVPAVFVGTEERLAELVRLLCAEVALSFQAAGLHMPPWREAHNIISKWMPARFTYTPMSPPASPSAYPRGDSPTDAGDGWTAAALGGYPAAAAAADPECGSPGEWGVAVPQPGGAGMQWGASKPAVSIRYFKLPGGASC